MAVVQIALRTGYFALASTETIEREMREDFLDIVIVFNHHKRDWAEASEWEEAKRNGRRVLDVWSGREFGWLNVDDWCVIRRVTWLIDELGR